MKKILIGLFIFLLLLGLIIFIDINFIHPFKIQITEIPRTYIN